MIVEAVTTSKAQATGRTAGPAAHRKRVLVIRRQGAARRSAGAGARRGMQSRVERREVRRGLSAPACFP